MLTSALYSFFFLSHAFLPNGVCFPFLCRGFRYYDLDAYYRRKMEKEMKKGHKKVVETERTVFNDEEQRRYVSKDCCLASHPKYEFLVP